MLLETIYANCIQIKYYLKCFALTCVGDTCKLTAYDWSAACLDAACVFDFFSGELDVGSE